MGLPRVSARLLGSAILLLASLFPCVLPVSAQRFVVTGRVIYESSGSAASQVPVILQNFTEMSVDQTATDSMGVFTFSVGRGTYYLAIRVAGYMEVAERVEVGFMAVNGIQLVLRAAPAKGLAAAGPSRGGAAIPADLLKVPARARESYSAGLRQFTRNGNLPASLRLLQRAIEIHPEFAEAHYWKGMVHLDLNEMASARAAFAAAIEYNERLAAAYFPLGSLLINSGEREKGAAILQKGLTLFDKYWQGHFELARAQVALGRLQEAEVSARRAQELKPDFPRIYVLLANVYWAQGRDAEALSAAEKFLQLAPDDPVAPEIARRVGELKPALKPPQL
jgi:tetratricopeptide (TPR) repeat protein